MDEHEQKRSGYTLTLLEPVELVRKRYQVFGKSGKGRDQTLVWNTRPEYEWKRIPSELARELYIPETALCYGLKIPDQYCTIGFNWIKHPFMIWNGENRLKLERPDLPPLWFDFKLCVKTPRRNKQLMEKQGQYMVDVRLVVQEEWRHVGNFIVYAIPASANPSWKLVLFIRETVRKIDGEPLLLCGDRSYALVHVLVVRNSQ